MSEIIQKISSYNLLNYLLPGVIFSLFLEDITNYQIVQQDIFTNAFIFYFIGLSVSRAGSLLLEPLLTRFKLLNFAEYNDYIEASKKDKLVEVLSESNNMYRTFISMFLILILFKIYETIAIEYSFTHTFDISVLISTLLCLFVLAYKKQTKYINKRVDSSKGGVDE